MINKVESELSEMYKRGYNQYDRIRRLWESVWFNKEGS